MAARNTSGHCSFGACSSNSTSARGLIRHGKTKARVRIPAALQEVDDDRGRVLNCLNANTDQLSQPCFQALTLRGLAYAGALKSCRADYERLCAGVPQGWGRGLQCMQRNAASLSPACHDALLRQGFLDDDGE